MGFAHRIGFHTFAEMPKGTTSWLRWAVSWDPYIGSVITYWCCGWTSELSSDS